MAICRISSLEDVKILWSLHDFLYTWDLGLYCQQLEENRHKLEEISQLQQDISQISQA